MYIFYLLVIIGFIWFLLMLCDRYWFKQYQLSHHLIYGTLAILITCVLILMFGQTKTVTHYKTIYPNDKATVTVNGMSATDERFKPFIEANTSGVLVATNGKAKTSTPYSEINIHGPKDAIHVTKLAYGHKTDQLYLFGLPITSKTETSNVLDVTVRKNY